METKELKIQIPEGYEIDKEKSTFEKIVFKKKDTKPRSWEEYCKQRENVPCHVLGYDLSGGCWRRTGIFNTGYCTVPSKELAEAFIVMMQLMSLRHDWIHKWSIDNGMTIDWKPDWEDECTHKYCIVGNYNNDFEIFPFCKSRCPLSFPTQEIAIEFKECFKDLLKVAKPLV